MRVKNAVGTYRSTFTDGNQRIYLCVVTYGGAVLNDCERGDVDVLAYLGLL